MQNIQTVKLNNGTIVLANKDRYGYFGAVTYTNHTQAINKAAQLVAQGIDAVEYYRGRVTYIKVNL